MCPAERERAHIELACNPASAGAARRFTRPFAPPGTAATVELLVSELVTNALVHGHGDIVLDVTASSDGIRVEVQDASASMPVTNAPVRLDPGTSVSELGDRGRGLQLVSAMATQWGTQRQGTGKSVWFELMADRRSPPGANTGRATADPAGGAPVTAH